ncbi:MAG: glycoside hydrolase family 32 protein [Mediterranea sp.]|nr:glycoside hydrolase family 32 protein [Mediterranea sp.]
MTLAATTPCEAGDPYRPVYHFTPPSGWMNDPNGMVYANGEYHLFYQYNPADMVWGPMHWGHAVSRDLVRWERLPIALYPDSLGTIFSGSAVIDRDNTAGFGPGAMVAIYTCAGKRQTQCLAYSLDNGRTFTKYAGNPVLTADVPDFRDPKVFWYQPTRRWVMILAVGQEMRLFSSPDLKAWTYESSFGHDRGAHGGVWECPDLFELPVEESGEKRWVLLCNINPGGPFGGSATQYFVGRFDGHRFVCDDTPDTTLWMDWGKDHYATVTWENAPKHRRVAMTWMSNWQYANQVPASTFRSANGIPRELALYTAADGRVRLRATPVEEVNSLRDESTKRGFNVADKQVVAYPLLTNDGACEIDLVFRPGQATTITFRLANALGETVAMRYDLLKKTFSMDRRQSGQTSFSPDFPAVTVAPLPSPVGKSIRLRLLIDKTSIEAFGDDGRFTMTNLVFPTRPYNKVEFEATYPTNHSPNVRVSLLNAAPIFTNRLPLAL